jgi:hypothetical protein
VVVLVTVSEHAERVLRWSALARHRSLNWVTRYQRQMVVMDALCGLLAGMAALLGRFPGTTEPRLYVVATAGLPLLWIASVAMFGGYDARFIGLQRSSGASSTPPSA